MGEVPKNPWRPNQSKPIRDVAETIAIPSWAQLYFPIREAFQITCSPFHEVCYFLFFFFWQLVPYTWNLTAPHVWNDLLWWHLFLGFHANLRRKNTDGPVAARCSWPPANRKFAVQRGLACPRRESHHLAGDPVTRSTRKIWGSKNQEATWVVVKKDGFGLDKGQGPPCVVHCLGSKAFLLLRFKV